ncbi:hypothetical protein [Sphingomicrobium nitratireducens]|uniref:hypothetical protein n=1 Tax=Sphingomicrobium nitratireducens TaxID=2964666 RepID=UPI00223F63EC|nr:hypothetical protein [Sphingomicrobium nitratireducens]
MDHDIPLVLAIAIPVVLLVAPVLLLAFGIRAQQGRRGAHAPRVSARRVLKSTFAFAIAFNLVFLVQELGLVVPKAFVPGLDPVLFHNNHNYTPADPVADLMQGGGVAALLVLGVVAMLVLQRDPPRHAGARLLLSWVTFWAWIMALIQLPSGVLDPGNDIARAFAYLKLSPFVQTLIGLVGLLAIPVVMRAIVPDFLAVGPQPVNRPTRRMVRVVLLPAFLGLPLIALFRLPGELDRVIVNPAIMAACGMLWMIALGWMMRADERAVAPARNFNPLPLKWLVATGVLLAGFQLILRPGIPF